MYGEPRWRSVGGKEGDGDVERDIGKARERENRNVEPKRREEEDKRGSGIEGERWGWYRNRRGKKKIKGEALEKINVGRRAGRV